MHTQLADGMNRLANLPMYHTIQILAKSYEAKEKEGK